MKGELFFNSAIIIDLDANNASYIMLIFMFIFRVKMKSIT